MTRKEPPVPAETMRHALVIQVPRKLENRIEDFYLNLAGTTKPTMGYHITLLGPFSLTPNEDALCLSQIARVCQAREPFIVELEGLHVSAEPNSNAILVDVARPQEIIALHDELLAALENQITFPSEQVQRWNVESYQPHVTVALGLSDKELAGFPVESSSQQCHASFQVTRVSLVGDKLYEPWRHLESFALGARSHSSEESIGSPQSNAPLDDAPYS